MSLRRLLHAAPLPPPPCVPARRVVVTGRGVVTPLGCDVASVWRRVVAGDVGVGAVGDVPGLDAADLPAQCVAAVPEDPTHESPFVLSEWVDAAHSRTRSPRFVAFALAAASQALEESFVLQAGNVDKRRVGVAIGSGIGGIEDVVDTAASLSTKGYRGGISPYFVPRILNNMAAGHVSIAHGLKGPNHAVSTACATGAHAIGDAYRMIAHGDADVMVAGGTEASVNRISLAGFAKARAMSTRFNDAPHTASRPFDKDRDGFVLGEGAGCVVLEALDVARARGAPILAEVRGYGLAGDAHHITAPPPDGNGARRAMEAALADAGLTPDTLDYVNAHATSTPMGDDVELAAIHDVVAPRVGRPVLVSSTKGATGHLLGAAGAVEAIFTINALVHNVVPPTANLHDMETEWLGVDVVRGAAEETALRVALSNSFGFGGTNCSLVFTVD